jgi:hypothetical protein
MKNWAESVILRNYMIHWHFMICLGFSREDVFRYGTTTYSHCKPTCMTFGLMILEVSIFKRENKVAVKF